MKPGDIIGFCGHGIESQLINIGTWGIPFWGLSHIGIMARFGDDLLLFESTTLCDEPCYIMKNPIDGVQAHLIENRIKNYKGKIWHYPLLQPLRAHESYILTKFLKKKLGVTYDVLGAVRSGGKLLARLEAYFHPESMANLFCSELCAAAHREIERFDTINVSEWNPNRFVREERRRGILGKPIRLH